jgi:hypothetical protein
MLLCIRLLFAYHHKRTKGEMQEGRGFVFSIPSQDGFSTASKDFSGSENRNGGRFLGERGEASAVVTGI